MQVTMNYDQLWVVGSPFTLSLEVLTNIVNIENKSKT